MKAPLVHCVFKNPQSKRPLSAITAMCPADHDEAHALALPYLKHRQLLPLLLYGEGSIRIVNDGCPRVFCDTLSLFSDADTGPFCTCSRNVFSDPLMR